MGHSVVAAAPTLPSFRACEQYGSAGTKRRILSTNGRRPGSIKPRHRHPHGKAHVSLNGRQCQSI
jgi:hypothetical protein